MEYHGSMDEFLGRQRTRKIMRFRLKCNSDDCCSFDVEEWVDEVVTRKVKHVNISLYMCHSSVFNLAALFVCTTLVTFDFSIPCNVHLPNLKSFHLHVYTFLQFPSISKLISGSPALELFHLKQKQYKHYFDELKIEVFHHNWSISLLVK